MEGLRSEELVPPVLELGVQLHVLIRRLAAQWLPAVSAIHDTSTEKNGCTFC